MKNRKRFRNFMLSAVALTALTPFAVKANVAQAAWINAPGGATPLKPTYGIAKTPKNGEHDTPQSPYMGVELNYQNGDAIAQYLDQNKTSGFLMPMSNMSAEPFGSTKSHFYTSMEGYGSTRYKWIVYNVRNSDAGKVGVLYKNALMYYPNNSKKSPIKLDAKLTWNGSYRPAGTGKNTNIHFSTHSISVKEPYTGAANFSLTLYKAGTNKPVSVKAKVTQKDIDYNQGIIFNTPAYLLTDFHAKLNSGLNQGAVGVNWPTTIANKSKVFGDDSPQLDDHQGTVETGDKRGWFSYIPKGSQSTYNVTFVHGYKTVPYMMTSRANFATASTSKPSATYKLSSLKKGSRDADRGKNYSDGGQADLFGFGFDKETNVPYKVPINKWVSKDGKSFGKTSKSSPINIDSNSYAYFDIRTRLKQPSIAYVKAGNKEPDYNALPLQYAMKDKNDPFITKADGKNKQRLVLKDYIDPSLEVVSAKVYQTNSNIKNLKQHCSNSIYG